jgi:rhodanese-related sulfurtransferase
VQPSELAEWLKQGQTKVVVLDTRKAEEFQISHIPGAIFADYDSFSEKNLRDIPKNAKVVVYCSVGYRSERIGEKLRKWGYANVQNLYGGIFEWVNQGLPILDAEGKPTSKVHTYNEDWGQWLDKGQKVF